MAYVVILLAVLARFAPHTPNFSPVYAALLFGGAYLKKRDAVWFPLVLLAASDVLLTTGVYRMSWGWNRTVDWAAFTAIALMGLWLRKRLKVLPVLGAALAAPAVFFIISNFGVWLGWQMYPPTWAGLIGCYVAAIPFFGNSLASSALYTGLLFGAWEFYRRKVAKAAASDLRAA